MTESAPRLGFALIHGGGLEAWVWQRMVPLLDLPAVATHRIPPATDRRKCSLSECADFVARQIANAPFDRALVVAHSIGGVLALELARRHRERVAGLVFLSANVPEDGRSSLHAFPLAQRLPMAFGQRLADFGLAPKKALREWVRETLCHDLDPEATQRMLEGALNPEPSALFFERVSREGLEAMPLTYVVLLRDRALPPHTQHRIAAGIGARIVPLDCGHTAMLARPRELAAILNEEARRIREAPPPAA